MEAGRRARGWMNSTRVSPNRNDRAAQREPPPRGGSFTPALDDSVIRRKYAHGYALRANRSCANRALARMFTRVNLAFSELRPPAVHGPVRLCRLRRLA